MATRKKESSLGKSKRPTCPSSIPVPVPVPVPVPRQGFRRHSLGSTLPTDGSATKIAQKTATRTSPPQSRRPDPLRRPDARPATPQKKPLVSPPTTRSSSFPTCIPKPTFERVATKLSTLSSSSRNVKAAPSPRPSIKRGITISSAPKKPPQDKKQAKKLETKHENKENLEQGDNQIPKAQVKEEKYILDDISTQQNQEPQSEQVEDKFHEQQPGGSNSSDQGGKDNDSEDQEIKASHDEETKIETQDKGAEEGNTTEEVASTSTSTSTSTEENSDEGNEKGLESVKDEEANAVAQSQEEAETSYGEKETIEEEANLVPAEAAHGKNESVQEDANTFPKSQVQVEAAAATTLLGKEETNESRVQVEEEASGGKEVTNSVPQAEATNGKNEPSTPEVTASKQVIARKGRVRALVGAFESQA